MENANKDTVILIDSPEAAEPVNMPVWKSRNGRVYFDEMAARYDGCTHVKCKDCGALTPKHRTVCGSCEAIREQKRYDALPKARWDGVAMIYSEARDEYFVDVCSAEDSLDEGESLADLRLVICKPVFASPIDTSMWSDDLADDQDLPDELFDIVEEANREIAKLPPLCWEPGKFALDVGE